MSVFRVVVSPSLGCYDTGTGGLRASVLLDDVPSDCVLAADVGERYAGADLLPSSMCQHSLM